MAAGGENGLVVIVSPIETLARGNRFQALGKIWLGKGNMHRPIEKTRRNHTGFSSFCN